MPEEFVNQLHFGDNLGRLRGDGVEKPSSGEYNLNFHSSRIQPQAGVGRAKIKTGSLFEEGVDE